MKSKIRHLRSILDEEKGKVEYIKDQIKKKSLEKKKYQRSFRANEKAQIVVQEVIRITKDKLKYHLSDISSLAMSSVFPNPYNVVFNFVPKRGKIEVDINFEKKGNLIQPFDSGGGAVDIASLSLRFSCWTLQNPKTRPILFLDEPLKFLKGKPLPQKGARMISEISKKLGIQIIMVSHNPDLIDWSDKILSVSIDNDGISIVEE